MIPGFKLERNLKFNAAHYLQSCLELAKVKNRFALGLVVDREFVVLHSDCDKLVLLEEGLLR